MDIPYNAKLEMMDSPIIAFPDQTNVVHQLLVFLKVFMVTVREINEMEMILVRRLRFYLISCYMALGCAMIAVSSELIWKAIPMFTFCYACQVLMLFSLEPNIRRCVSYVLFAFCCLEISGFEFLYDIYLILCFSFKSLHCLTQFRDHQQRERNGLQRVRDLLFLVTDAVMLLNADVVDYKFILFSNAFVAVGENVRAPETQYVATMYLVINYLIISGLWFGYNLGEMIDEVLKQMWMSLLEFTTQFVRGF